MRFHKTLLIVFSLLFSIDLFSQQTWSEELMITPEKSNFVKTSTQPQSDDGLLTWNFLDSYLEKKNVNNQPVSYPVFKYVK